MSALVIEKQPTNEPVTLTQMKNFLRISNLNDDDALISDLIVAARELVEAFTNRSLCFKGYRQSLDSFPYFTDTVQSQMAFPPSYYALPRYSTTLWNYSQMIKLYAAPLVSVDRISFLASSDQQWHDMVQTPPLWYPGTAYASNALVMDANANVQKCTTPGTSDSNPPAWNKTVGGVTVEGTDPGGEGSGPVQWTNQGPFTGNSFVQVQAAGDAQFGAFTVDTDSEPARIFPGPPGNYWPSVLYQPNAVQIHFTAGFSADGSKVPSALKMAIQQCVANWYENREAAMPGTYNELPMHTRALLYAWKVEDFQPTRG
jgi:hypothetical protein